MLICIFVQTPTSCGINLEMEESDKIIDATLNK